ncbi:MAG: 1-acyl-sn-glycerol-3-phosphate acyltransferase [Desulfobacteraceae bacterium 4572_35.1]|nr:MAG: 1-acyl-sn-glycerol-3-phosphate acyltransferase [Desulfobacteraceae bacterium 4572_35.1]
MLTVKLNNGCYTTSTNPKSLCNKLPSCCFYPQLFWIVLKATLMAKQGIYTAGDWAKNSLDTLTALERCGIQFEISGMEHVCSSNEPCVFIGNHMSTLETFILPTLISPYRSVTFVVKKSLTEYPLFKWVMNTRDPIVVSRTNPREDLKTVLNQGVEKLRAGTSIVVFPQTTRTTEFEPQHFNSIGIKLAKKAGVPIIPLALKTDAWSNGKKLKEFGKILVDKKVHFSFGSAVDSSGNANEIQDNIIQFIQEHLQNWQS